MFKRKTIVLKKVILYIGLVVGGFLLGYFKANKSIDKEIRTELLKKEELQSLYFEIESLKYTQKTLEEQITQSLENESNVAMKRAESGVTLLDIAKDLDSYTHEELKAKLFYLALELSE